MNAITPAARLVAALALAVLLAGSAHAVDPWIILEGGDGPGKAPGLLLGRLVHETHNRK